MKIPSSRKTGTGPSEKVPLRVAIDQRFEQTLNRDAKTTGGITHFASDNSGDLLTCHHVSRL